MIPTTFDIKCKKCNCKKIHVITLNFEDDVCATLKCTNCGHIEVEE